MLRDTKRKSFKLNLSFKAFNNILGSFIVSLICCFSALLVCRLCAINRGVYMLNKPIEKILYNDDGDRTRNSEPQGRTQTEGFRTFVCLLPGESFWQSPQAPYWVDVGGVAVSSNRVGVKLDFLHSLGGRAIDESNKWQKKQYQADQRHHQRCPSSPVQSMYSPRPVDDSPIILL